MVKTVYEGGLRPFNSMCITGSVIDELDAIFKDWFNRRECPLKLHGTCQTYTAENDYTLVTSETGIICSPDNDDCQQKICDIDMYHIDQVNDYMARNPDWVPTPAESESPEIVQKKDSCCGLAITDTIGQIS